MPSRCGQKSTDPCLLLLPSSSSSSPSHAPTPLLCLLHPSIHMTLPPSFFVNLLTRTFLKSFHASIATGVWHRNISNALERFYHPPRDTCDELVFSGSAPDTMVRVSPPSHTVGDRVIDMLYLHSKEDYSEQAARSPNLDFLGSGVLLLDFSSLLRDVSHQNQRRESS